MSSISLVSFSLAALPWMFPSIVGLGIGLIAHIVWFVACERLLPPVLVLAPAAPASAGVTGTRAAGAAVAPARASAKAPAPAPAAPRRPAAPPSPVARPKGFVQTPVIATFDETADIKTFRMLRPEGFDFEAGQFLAVRIRVDGQDYVRCYSLSSSPAVRGYLEISVKRQGVVSNALFATARPGSMLAVKAPAGAFRYPSGDDRPILLIAGGIGITPLLCMLRHAVSAEPNRPVTLIYAAHDDTGFAFGDELGAIARRHPLVRMYSAASKGASRPHIYRGRVDETLLKTVAPELVHSIALICGPTPMIDGTRALLAKLGVPKSQIRYEVFEAAVAVAARPETDPAPAAAAAKSPARTACHQMLCEVSGSEVQVQPDQTLLEAAEGAGIEIQSLCRAGVCGACRVQVTAGDVNCESTTLGDEDRADGFVLACVTTAGSDCTVQA